MQQIWEWRPGHTRCPIRPERRRDIRESSSAGRLRRRSLHDALRVTDDLQQRMMKKKNVTPRVCNSLSHNCKPQPIRTGYMIDRSQQQYHRDSVVF